MSDIRASVSIVKSFGKNGAMEKKSKYMPLGFGAKLL